MAHTLQPIGSNPETKRGSYGIVIQVRRKDGLNGLLALKALYDYKWDARKLLELSLREAWTWSQLSHPNIAPFCGVVDYSEVYEGRMRQLCMLSPWATLGNMEEYINTTELGWSELLTLLWDIASGLEYLHDRKPRPIIHGDLKPNNVLLYHENTSPSRSPRIVARLVDFGSARSLTNHESVVNTTTTSGAGNPRFLAWERLDPSEHDIQHTPQAMTTYSDVFEMSRTFLQLVTRKAPYHLLSDMDVLRKICHGENPARPGEGVLHSHTGMWTTLLECWRNPAATRLHAMHVKALLEYYRVCTKWRHDAVLAHTDFRKDSDIDLPTIPERLHDVMKHVGFRAAPLFLSLDSIDMTCSDRPWNLPNSSAVLNPGVLQQWKDILPQSGWRSLSVQMWSVDSIVAALDCCTVAFDSAEHVKIVFHDPNLQTEDEPLPEQTSNCLLALDASLFDRGHNLYALDIQSFPFEWVSSMTLPRLQVLDLRHQPLSYRPAKDDWTALLAAVPNLSSLTIVGSGPQLRDIDDLRIKSQDITNLRRLETLRIGDVAPFVLPYLLMTIAAPALIELHLHTLQGVGYDMGLEILTTRRFPHLKVLRLVELECGAVAFSQMLHQLDKLSMLHLWAGDQLFEVLKAHQATLEGQLHPLLPDLHTLRLAGYACQDVLPFLIERQRHERPLTTLITDQHGHEDMSCHDIHRQLARLVHVQHEEYAEIV